MGIPALLGRNAILSAFSIETTDWTYSEMSRKLAASFQSDSGTKANILVPLRTKPHCPGEMLARERTAFMFDAKERLNNFQKGVGTLQGEIPDSINALFGFIGAAQKEGALTVREKELIAIGISIYHRCEDCIAVHAHKALEAGCTRTEILEAASMGIVFGGGPSLGATTSLLLPALEQFENKA